MTGVLLLIGALVLAAAALKSLDVVKLAKNGNLESRWRVLAILLVLFMLAYLVGAAAYFSAAHALFMQLAGLAALLGAVFVTLVVHLGLKTLRTLNTSMAAERIEAQKAEGMLRDLMEVNEQITHSNRELEQFAYVASHDLQEPLRKITAFGDLLAATEASRLSDEGKDCIVRMQKASRRMSALISALLSFSWLSREKEEAEPLELKALVAEVLEDLETAIHKAGATVIVGELPCVDGRRQRQAFDECAARWRR